MRASTRILGWFVLVAALSVTQVLGQGASDGWKAHDMTRPKPPTITPPAQHLPVPAPEGAVILFDGGDLSAWTAVNGSEAQWTVAGDYFEVKAGAGTIRSREHFGDVQLHVEWSAPVPPTGSGQNRGNSGIFLMGRYEVQVLDSYENETYADGQAAAIYGQYPPRFNAMRPPGEWQTYDIFFRRPRFEDGAVVEPARVTVVHNGVLVQDNTPFIGPTAWLKHMPYAEHADALPIELQDHGDPVRFRSIWALPLPERPLPGPDYGIAAHPELSADDLAAYAGAYRQRRNQAPIEFRVEEGRLVTNFDSRPDPFYLVPVGDDLFDLRDTDAQVAFERGNDGSPSRVIIYLNGSEIRRGER